MKRFGKQLILVSLVVIGFVHCELEVNAQTSPGSEAVNGLAFNLYATLTSQATNVFFSPLSVSAAFAPIYVGSGGTTKTQLEAVFGFGTEGVAEVLLSPGNLVQLGDSDKSNLFLANKLYIQKGFPLKSQFLNQIPEGNGMERLDFGGDPEGSLKKINLFVNETTQGNIVELLTKDSIDGTTRLVVANSVFFTGKWKAEFNASQTQEMEFKGFSETFNVKTMVLEDARLRISDENGLINNSQILDLPYGDGSASMIIVLPKEFGKQAFSELEKALLGTDVAKLLQNMSTTRVNVRLPKFQIEQSADLTKLLPNLGVTDIFDEVKADLAGISEEELFVSAAVHKARVEVDEKGTIAAGASAVIATPRSLVTPHEFTADHPFIYFIIDNQSKSVLFMGNVRQFPPIA